MPKHTNQHFLHSNTTWAIFFSVVLLRDCGILNFKTISCAVLVVVCGILAAVDCKELFKKNYKAADR